MSHNRAPKPGHKWYLPYNTYQTAVNFCYSYKEMMDRLADLDGRHSHSQDGTQRASGTSDPTAKEGIKRMELEKRIEVIEDAVMATAPELSRWLFLGVTQRGTTYTYLHDFLGMPCGKNQYSKYRREIYYRVAERIM